MPRFHVFFLALLVTFSTLSPAYSATHTINSNTIWVNQGDYTAGDNIVITNTGRLRIVSGGVDGGTLYVTLVGAGGLLQINQGGILDLSATGFNGNGGTLNVNSLGSGASIIINGSILANGAGSGRGGVISMNADNMIFGATAAIRAMGGFSGEGGVINLKQNTGTLDMLNPGFVINTSGISSNQNNLITIEADGVNINNNIIASAGLSGDGGKVMVKASDGSITIRSNADIAASSLGGDGGTLELTAHSAGTDLAMDRCFDASCSGADLIRVHDFADINISGSLGSHTGVLRVGRSGSGDIVQDMDVNTGHVEFYGVGEVHLGDDSHTNNLTISNFDASTDFNGSNPDVYLTSSGNITASVNNDFDRLTMNSSGGDMSLLDTTGGLDLTILNATGTVDVTAQNNGEIVLRDSTSTAGSMSLNTNNNIDATSNNKLAGDVAFYGQTGTGSSAGTVSVVNKTGLNITGLEADSASLQTTSFNGDLSGSGIDLSGNLDFSSYRDVSLVGEFGGTVTGSGARTYINATSGDITSAGLTASSSVGWNGADDESMVMVADNGDILGSGYITTGAANMRLQAGTAASQNVNSDINVSNVTSIQHASFHATGDSSGVGTGDSIRIGGTSRVAGHTTATGISVTDNFSATEGNIDIGYTAGNLTTAMVWSDKYVTLSTTGLHGDILQDVDVYGSDYNNEKTVYSNTGDINLTANGGAYSYISTGAVTMGGDITARASGDIVGNGNGASVKLVGYAQENTTVTNEVGGATTGQVVLGTAINDPDDLTGNTYYDSLGDLDVDATHDFFYYGFVNGDVTASARKVWMQLDKGGLNINGITASATTGDTIYAKTYLGSIVGNAMTTAGSANVVLEAGSQFPRDNMSHIDITGVNIGGDFTATVTGDSNGNTTGNSVIITGSIGGETEVKHLTDDVYLGTVSTP